MTSVPVPIDDCDGTICDQSSQRGSSLSNEYQLEEMLLKKAQSNSFLNEQREETEHPNSQKLFEHSLAMPIFGQADAGLDNRIYNIFLKNNQVQDQQQFV